MSSTLGTDDGVTVRDDGVTVRKQYMSTEFPVPAIQFEIESDLEDAVSIRLTESIPEAFSMDAIGFHPEYHSDQWTAYQDHRIEFTGTLEPDDTLVTVYGIRSDEEIDTSGFLTEPEIETEVDEESTDPGSDDVSKSVEAVVSTDANNIVKDMLSGERDSVPGLDEEPPSSGDSASPNTGDDPEESGGDSDSSDPPIELDIDAAAERVAREESKRNEDDPHIGDENTVDLGDDNDDEYTDVSETTDSTTDDHSEVTPGSPEDDIDSDVHSQDYPATSSESVASQLASELKTGSVDDADLAVIYEALANEPSGPTRAKIEHLQQRVEDVAAYTGALKEFLDDEGTAEQVQSDLSTLRMDVDSNTDSLDGLSETVESVEERIDTLDSDIDGVADDVDSLSDDVDDLEDDFDSLSEDVVNIVEWRDQLGSMFTED